MIAARRPHVLWMIEHYPEELGVVRGLAPGPDPVGYAEARKRWLAHEARPDVTPAVLSQAVRFLQVGDKPVAERILLRLQASDRGGQTPRVVGRVYHPTWTSRLGVVYALGILGSDDETLGNVARSTNPAEAHGAFAAHAREMLTQTRDAGLLAAAGGYLVRNATNAKADFDHVALGMSYLERAVALDPNSPARKLVESYRAAQEHNRRREELRAQAAERAGGEVARKMRARERLTEQEETRLRELQFEVAASMTDRERFECLLDQPWICSARPGHDLLELAERFKDDPRYGDAMFHGSLMRGTEALAEGDVRAAVRDMQQAARAPSPSELISVAALNLPTDLLHNGERESVAAFYDRVAELFPAQRERALEYSAAIRAGRMTPTYQARYARPQ
jgi:hypothetical protein